MTDQISDEKFQMAQDIATTHEHPVSSENLYPFSLAIHIKTKGKLERLSSRFHAIKYQLSNDNTETKIQLKEPNSFDVSNDFVLYYRDKCGNDPVALVGTNEFGE
jgi:hypothetical protein